jgi:uncharacterized cupredoxin-like copper-binding protein
MKRLPIVCLVGVLITCAAVAIACHGEAAASVDWSKAEAVELRMTEYEFVPNQLRFRRDMPYRLHLINIGKEGHDFTAGDFLSAVEVRNPDVLNESRTSIFLEPAQNADIYFVARRAGLFAPRCADHDWAGMTATIIVD